uniref:ATP synthase subunit a n=1 Tax=Rediviva intermixta TaxID=1688786 RepID=A0A172C938_9HYME|nr:ATP synthase F0 subunit 6 [Rediviva intermixta]AKS40059.1 ATP synthase F0 subunit 6 [Rediviva intermixta]
MYLNLFSIFDPCTSMLFSLNWISIFMPMFFFPMKFWVIPSYLLMFWNLFIMLMFNEFKILMKKFKINLIIFITLLIYLMLLNLLSLMPYIFTPTSHMSVNLSLSLILWISFMLYGWLNFYDSMFIHLLPMNTPVFLMNFMIVIETISNIIRPWTLAIRLTANMLAGHLLLLLLSSSIKGSYIILVPLIILAQIFLLILEIFVSFIQSYVFTILSLLYFNESNY